jgi:hypothetical protein
MINRDTIHTAITQTHPRAALTTIRNVRDEEDLSYDLKGRWLRVRIVPAGATLFYDGRTLATNIVAYAALIEALRGLS